MHALQLRSVPHAPHHTRSCMALKHQHVGSINLRTCHYYKRLCISALMQPQEQGGGSLGLRGVMSSPAGPPRPSPATAPPEPARSQTPWAERLRGSVRGPGRPVSGSNPAEHEAGMNIDTATNLDTCCCYGRCTAVAHQCTCGEQRSSCSPSGCILLPVGDERVTVYTRTDEV